MVRFRKYAIKEQSNHFFLFFYFSYLQFRHISKPQPQVQYSAFKTTSHISQSNYYYGFNFFTSSWKYGQIKWLNPPHLIHQSQSQSQQRQLTVETPGQGPLHLSQLDYSYESQPDELSLGGGGCQQRSGCLLGQNLKITFWLIFEALYLLRIYFLIYQFSNSKSLTFSISENRISFIGSPSLSIDRLSELINNDNQNIIRHQILKYRYLMQEPTTEIQFPQYILKNLLDKNEQKRDSACKQLEIIAKKSALKKNFAQIQKFITFFKDKYISANDFNKKKAGLEALTSITFGIKVNSQAVDKLAGIIVDIILETLNQQEHKVRYTALKSLYFICQSLEQKILKMFNRIFESIIGKMTDLDQQTRNAARFLDSALQTALNSALLNSQNQQMFNIKQFMGILKSKFKSMNPAIRQFLIRWINVLNEIVSVDLLQYLPDLLEDLLFMLGDKEKTLKVSAQECLKNFEKQMAEKFIEGKLESIISLGTIDQILSILIKVAKGKSHVNSKITTLNYLKLLISFFKSQLDPKAKLANNKNFFKKVILDRFDQVLEPILLLMSYEEEQVRKISFQTNQMLMVAIQMINKEEPINFSKVMPLLKTMLSEKRSTSTSESALKWMKFMLQNYNDKILPQINDIIERLVQKLCDPSGKNVIQIIENTTVTEQYFERLIEKMLMLLMNKSQTDDKPEHILKRFSSILEPDKFCKTLAAQVIQTFSEDYQFIFEIVQYLTQLIITEKNMQKVRKKLQNKKDIQFFHTLFKAFSYNPAAATCLCLLAQQFQLAYKIVTTLGNQVQITQGVLTGFCKVTTMIQSPGFLFLRLQMLNRREHPYLIETLCAILMILPQGKISNILKNRLEISKITIDSKVIEQKQKNGSMKKSLMEEGNLSLSGIQKLLTDYLQIQKKFAAVNSK